MTLRSRLIHLAHQNPELRGDLLPLLKMSGYDAGKYRFTTKDLTFNTIKEELGHIPQVHFDIREASDFIESVLLQAPINPFILRLSNDGSVTLLDGVWRLSVLDAFRKGEFALTNLDYFPEFEGKTIAGIPPNKKRLLATTPFRTYVLEPGMTDEMVNKFVRQIGHPRSR